MSSTHYLFRGRSIENRRESAQNMNKDALTDNSGGCYFEYAMVNRQRVHIDHNWFL